MASDADTQEFKLALSPESPTPKPLSRTLRVDVAGLSHPGKVRPNNEDHFLVVHFGRFMESVASNLPSGLVPSCFKEDGWGMAVADGMGGHVAGEEASRLAIATLVSLVQSTPDWILRADDPEFAEEIMRRASERFDLVDQALSLEAAFDPKLHGFGTTMTLAASVGLNLFIAHIGDSRAYLFRRGKLHQLTRDHTLAGELYEAGQITLAQVATHHLRHVLTRNLGRQKTSKPDVQKLSLEPGDCLLLCSDGLNDMVSNDKIAAILAQGKASAILSQELIDLALAAGGKDNVTVILAQYSRSEN